METSEGIAVFVLCLLAYRFASLKLLQVYPSGPTCTSDPLSEPLRGSQADPIRKRPKYIAHRGQLTDGWGKGSENSIEAFKNCAEEKVDMVELDVQLTRDGTVVVFHDETLERIFPKLSSAQVYIRELDRRQIPKEVPNFSEVLDVLKDIQILVEIKHGEKNGLATAKAAADVIDKHGDWGKIVWGSFSSKEVNVFCRKMKPDTPTVYSSSEILAAVVAYFVGFLPFMSFRKGDHVWFPNDIGYFFLFPMMKHLARRGMVVVGCNYQEGSLNIANEVTEAFQSGCTTISTERYLHFHSQDQLERAVRSSR